MCCQAEARLGNCSFCHEAPKAGRSPRVGIKAKVSSTIILEFHSLISGNPHYFLFSKVFQYRFTMAPSVSRSPLTHIRQMGHILNRVCTSIFRDFSRFSEEWLRAAVVGFGAVTVCVCVCVLSTKLHMFGALARVCSTCPRLS